jgi:hypothetical protein
MNNKIIIVLLALFAGILNFSCEKVIPFDMPKVSKKLVVNGILKNTEAIRITVSYSREVLDSSTIIYSKTAKVKLYENDQFVEQLVLTQIPTESSVNVYNPSFYYDAYLGKTIPQPGRKYKIEVTDEGYPQTWAEIKMPDMPNLLSVDTIQVEADNDNYYSRKLEFSNRISDKPAERNYYEFSFMINQYTDKRQVFKISNGYKYLVFEGDTAEYLYRSFISYPDFNDTKFTEEIDDDNGFCSDNLFDGKEASLTFQVSSSSWYGEKHVSRMAYQVNVASVTEDYFIFKKSLTKYDEAEDNPLAEKTHVKSNIQGGMGFIGGMTISKKELTYYQRADKK